MREGDGTAALRPILAIQPLRSSAGKLPFGMAGIDSRERRKADFRRDVTLCRLCDSRRRPGGKALDLLSHFANIRIKWQDTWKM